MDRADTAADAATGELSFPDGFLWGAATAAHQIEGGNVNNDSWAKEHDPDAGYAESSGDACDSLHRWPEDVELVAAMGLGAYRFSLEWSRIEPAEGEFSNAGAGPLPADLRGMPPTGHRPRGHLPPLHHPDLARLPRRVGGGGRARTFARFVTRAGDHLGDLIGWACTINELNLIGVKAYDPGASQAGSTDNFARHLAINEAMVRAHRLGVDALRSGPGDFPIGLTLSMDEMVADPGGEGVLEAAREILEDRFFRATEGDDFIGVQCYSRVHFGPEGQAPNDPGVPTTQMGYEYWPQGVEHCARRAAAMTGLPVLLTESGIATDNDAERITLSSEVLRWCAARPRRRRGHSRVLRVEPAGQLRVVPRVRAQVRTPQRRSGDLRPPSQAQRIVVRGRGQGQPSGGPTGLSPVRTGTHLGAVGPATTRHMSTWVPITGSS